MRINYKGVSFLVGEQKTYYIDYGDFEDLVAEVYGFEYNLRASEEMYNNSTFEVGHIPLYYFDKSDQEDLDVFVENRGKGVSYITDKLFHDLNSKGIIPAGHYIVCVS